MVTRLTKRMVSHRPPTHGYPGVVQSSVDAKTARYTTASVIVIISAEEQGITYHGHLSAKSNSAQPEFHERRGGSDTHSSKPQDEPNMQAVIATHLLHAAVAIAWAVLPAEAFALSCLAAAAGSATTGAFAGLAMVFTNVQQGSTKLT
jgi:hypothetical protein